MRVGIAFDGQAAGAGHDGGQRLGAAHAAETAGQDPLAREIAVVMLAAGLDEGFIGALHDALGADIDPRAGGHLAVHGQTLLIQFVEMIPGRPMRHEVGIGDQHARRILVGAEHADRLARLHQQRLVFVEVAQRLDDLVEIGPGAGGPADAAIDDQFMRVFGHFRIEIVHQHAQRRFGHPAFGGQLGAAGGADVADIVARIGHLVPLLVGASVSAADSMRVRMSVQVNAKSGRLGVVIGEGRRLGGQMGGLRQFHLDRMHAGLPACRSGASSSRP